MSGAFTPACHFGDFPKTVPSQAAQFGPYKGYSNVTTWCNIFKRSFGVTFANYILHIVISHNVKTTDR